MHVHGATSMRLDTGPARPPAGVVRTESRPNETLHQVGERYGVSRERMEAANLLVRDGADVLADGTMIDIPFGEGDGFARSYTFMPGEDPAAVAQAHGTTEQALRDANGLGSGEAIYPGTTLLIPKRTETSAQARENGSTAVDKLQKQFPSLAGRQPESLQKIAGNTRKLRDGTPAEKLQALAELARDLKPKELDKLAKQLSLESNKVYKLATDEKALGALATLGDPKSTAADRVMAGLTLGGALGKLVPKEIAVTLAPFLSSLPAGKALVGAIAKFADPQASALDLARSTLALAQAVRDSAGNGFKSIARDLRLFDSSLGTLGAGLTLVDPGATLEDKAQAALALGADVPALAGDLQALRQLLATHGVGGDAAQQIAAKINELPAVQRLPRAVAGPLDADVARQLSTEQANRIARSYAQSAAALRAEALQGVDPRDAGKLAQAAQAAVQSAKDHGQSISKVLGQIEDPAARGAFIDALGGATSHAGRKALVDTVAGWKPGLADRLLTGTVGGKPAGEVLAAVLGKLGGNPEALEKFTGIIATAGDRTLKLALQVGSAADAKVLVQALERIGGERLGLAGKALGAMAGVLDKAGVDVTAAVAEKVLKGVAKAVPVAGALPAAFDTVRMGRIVADSSLPPDVRFLAVQAARLNGADALLSVAEPFVAELAGVPVAVDVGLAAVEVAFDVVITDQMARHAADPGGYRAPDWLKAANLGMSAAQGPQGALVLGLVYGPKGAVELAGSGARIGAKAAADGNVLLHRLAAQGVGQHLHLTAQGLHQLADVVRNPTRYAAAGQALVASAVTTLAEAAQGAGATARQAAGALGQLVPVLQQRGADGIEALRQVASHPGETALQAAEALSNLAARGLERADAAGRAVAQGAVSALGWVARSPGAAREIARQALAETAAGAGHLAKEAWDELATLGDDGVQLARDITARLQSAGAAGVETLKHVATHPGPAADAVRTLALESLRSLAGGIGDAAVAATHAVIDLVDTGVREAGLTAAELLRTGGDAARRIGDIWSGTLSQGAREVIDGMADLGDAGLDALNDLKDAGVGFAADVLDGIRDRARIVGGLNLRTPW